MEALTVTDWDLQQQALSSELSDNTRAAYQKVGADSWTTALRSASAILCQCLPTA